MIKVAIIGCGKMAEQHAVNIQKIPGFEIVGVCDKEILMAEQLGEHFSVSRYFDDPKELLQETSPEIVHITTPPQGHHQLGILCLEAGCHVLIEKPFTVNAIEAKEVLSLANSKNLKITVGHNMQFSHAALKLRDLVRNNFLGSQPVHMESIFCYDVRGATFAAAFLGDKRHWVHQLPGNLPHNIISHGIGQIAEYLHDGRVRVTAVGFTSDYLRSLGETEIVDELRVIIQDQGNTTAYFTFSSQMHPKLHQFRLFGETNGLVMDADHESVIKLKGRSYKSYLNQFIPPVIYAGQHLRNAAGNMAHFSRRDFHSDGGTCRLIECFYRSVVENTPLPVSHREIMTTASIIDEIFKQLNNRHDSLTHDV